MKPCRLHSCRHAFSLVELAIVLVILGLLAGGTLGALELMQNGQLRSMGSEMSRYETAVTTFRDKYQALPGDFSGAVAIWGSAGGTGNDATCMGTVATGIRTCDGNGDGVILTSVTALDESFRAWQHLGNAQLVDANFSGTTQGMSVADVIGKAVPDSRVEGLGYEFNQLNKTTDGWSNAPDMGIDLPVFLVAAPSSTPAPTQLNVNALSGYQVGMLDEKIDDGKPGLGKIVVSASGLATQCIDSTNAATAQYKVVNEDRTSCRMYYLYLDH